MLTLAPVAHAQQVAGKDKAPADERSRIARWLNLNDSVPVFQGISLSLDAVGPGGAVLGSDFTYAEAAIEVNLLNRFFPIVEIGYGSTDATNEDTELHYKTAAPYFRIGANYNVQHKKKLPGYIFAGARLAYSAFSYDVDGPSMADPVWGGEIPFHFTGIKSHALWGEVMAGVRAQVYKNFHMGWSFRYKVRLNVKETPNSSPWYIPGYGANGSTKFGVTYNLIYYLPWK